MPLFALGLHRRSRGATAALLFGALIAAPAAPAQESSVDTCRDRLAPREIRLHVGELPTALHRLGLHEDFLELRASARLSAAGLLPRPPLANGCRYLEIAVEAAPGTPPTSARIRVRAVEPSAPAHREFSEAVTLTGGAQLESRRADIERVLQAVARQVDAFVRSTGGTEVAAAK